MIDYLYRLDYDDKSSSANAEGTLVMNANVYAIADKYGIPSLKEIAQRKTAEALKTDSNHESFLTALDIVWTTTPLSDRGLRGLFLPVIAKNKKILLEKEDFVRSVRTNGDLAVDVLDYTWTEAQRSGMMYCIYPTCRGKGQNVQCGHCKKSTFLFMEREK